MGDTYDHYEEPTIEEIGAYYEHRREAFDRAIAKHEAQQRQKKYVVGLAHDGYRMAFIKKNRPEWQAGLLNGIGGKVEEKESWDDAMVREFEEETGVRVDIEDWRPVVNMVYPGQSQIFFYTAFVAPSVLGSLRTTTDEAIEVHSIEYVSLYPANFIRNLHWIVPLALHGEEYAAVDVEGYVDPVVGDIVTNSTHPTLW